MPEPEPDPADPNLARLLLHLAHSLRLTSFAVTRLADALPLPDPEPPGLPPQQPAP